MRIRSTTSIAAALFVCALVGPRPAASQSFDAVGTRAMGMGGAFVAVADDATATWWNPAGLASGAYLNAIIERSRSQEPADPALASGPALRTGTTASALAYPALGLSYYRLRVSQVAPATATSIGAPQPDRQDQGTVILRSAAVTSFGVTVGQSLGNHLVLASTLRLVRAGTVVSTETAPGGGLDQADDLDVPRDTGFDQDLGAMLRFGWLRVGVAIQHVYEPGFGEADNRLVLERQSRAGVAIMRGKTGVLDALTIDVDSDLNKSTTVLGDARQLAAGGEIWMVRRRVGLRGGLTGDTLGEHRTSRSTGVSVALRTGMYIDGAWTVGSDERRTGWSFSLRSSF